MPDNWINERKLTSEDAIYDLDGNKIHDLIDTEVEGGNFLDFEKYPVLGGKLPIVYLFYDFSTFAGARGIGWVNGNLYAGAGGGIGVFNDEGVPISSFTPTGMNSDFIRGISDVVSDYYYVIQTGTINKISKVNYYTNQVDSVVHNPTTDKARGLAYNYDKGLLAYMDSGNIVEVDLQGVVIKSTSISVIPDYPAGISYDEDGYKVCTGTLLYRVDPDTYSPTLVTELQGEVFWAFSSDGTKVTGVTTGVDGYIRNSDEIGAIIPTLTRPTGSPHPYKIVADATSE